jgi:hypothetical protein
MENSILYDARFQFHHEIVVHPNTIILEIAVVRYLHHGNVKELYLIRHVEFMYIKIRRERKLERPHDSRS